MVGVTDVLSEYQQIQVLSKTADKQLMEGRIRFSKILRILFTYTFFMLLVIVFPSTLLADDSFNPPIKISRGEVGGNPILPSYKISPDGHRVIYQADQDADGIDELYSVPITGGRSIRLNSELLHSYPSITISPDSKWVFYIAGRGTNSPDDIFKVAITGGDNIHLNSESNFQFIDILKFYMSSDGQWLLFSADNPMTNTRDLFSLSTEGGAVIRLSHDLFYGTRVVSYAISPDSQNVVYSTRYPADGVYSVPIDGAGIAKRISTELPLFDGHTFFSISPDSKHVVYTTSKLINNRYINELFSVPIEGGDIVRLHNNLDVESVSVLNFISSDGRYVIYNVRNTSAPGAKLFSVSINGGTPIRLDTHTNNGNDFSDFISDYQIIPNASRVVYSTGRQLFSVSILGENLVELSDRRSLRDFKISPNGSRAVYLAAIDPSSVKLELFSVSVNGGTPKPLTSNSAQQGSVRPSYNYKITPDSKRVVYIGRQEGGGMFELFTAPIDGGYTERINNTLPQNGDSEVKNFTISSNANYIIYLADQDVSGRNELYSSSYNRPKVKWLPSILMNLL